MVVEQIVEHTTISKYVSGYGHLHSKSGSLLLLWLSQPVNWLVQCLAFFPDHVYS